MFAKRECLACFLLVMSIAMPVSTQTNDWPNEDPPPPLLRREVVFPEFETRTLENGLRVVYVGHHEQPAVNVRLLLRAGASSDPSDKLGVASLVGQLLDQGTTTRTAPEIAGVIDNVGGALAAGGAGELSFVDVLVMKDSFDLGLDMLADVTRRPGVCGPGNRKAATASPFKFAG